MNGAGATVLRSDELEVTLLPEHGGRLHRVRAFGHDLLRTPDDPALHRSDPFFWGAYPMAPWCNRAAAGRHALAGRTVDLRPNFSDGSAIHGLVATEPWSVEGDGELRVVGGGDDGWPWRFEVTLLARVDAATLDLDYRLANRSDAPMPAGLGLHPWFRAPIEVRVPGERVYPTNTDSPAEPRPVDGALDLRRLAPPASRLDATWAELGEPLIELAWPDPGIAARIEVEAPQLLVAVASPPEAGAVAVEAQTHGPDPMRRLEAGEVDAPILLRAGDALRLALRLSVARRPT